MASAMVWCACLWVWKMYDIWADIEQLWRSLNILRLTRATGTPVNEKTPHNSNAVQLRLDGIFHIGACKR
jgi:hypothetical protein